MSFAQAPRLVTDMVTGGPTVVIPPLHELASFNGGLFFADEYHLYRYDAGTDAVAVIREFPQEAAREPRHFHRVGDRLLFVANASYQGAIWSTDGTNEGMHPVFRHSVIADWFSDFVVAGQYLFYRVGDRGQQLWRTDGTTNGTVMLHEDSRIRREFDNTVVALGDIVLFQGLDGSDNSEVWRTDGTPEGTYLFADILPGPWSSQPRQFFAHAGIAYFIARHAEFGDELWRTDGTPEGTFFLKDINPGAAHSDAINHVAFGDIALFYGYSNQTGFELWRTDGTPKGTHIVSDVFPGAGSSNTHAAPVVAGDGSFVLFPAGDGLVGTELWRSDGTAEGTVMVADINPGSEQGVMAFSNVVTAEGFVYFSGRTPTTGDELWRSDGTAAGTSLVVDIDPDTQVGVRGNLIGLHMNEVYFLGEPHMNPDYDLAPLYRTDGTAEGTRWIFPLPPPGATADSYPNLVRAVGDRIYLRYTPRGTGFTGLWACDGNAASMRRLTTRALNASAPRSYVATPDRTLFFPGPDDFGFSELWKSDGTPAGTRLVRDIAPGEEESDPDYFHVFGNSVIFAASHPAYGREMWRSDGTPKGTTLLTDFIPGPESSNYLVAAELGGRMLITSMSHVAAVRLWISDGTPAGTALLSDFDGFGEGSINWFVTVGDRCFFQLARNNQQAALWVTDGTPEGTREFFRDPDSFFRITGGVAPTSNGFYFVAWHHTTGDELWFCDGTPEGVRMIRELVPGTHDANPDQLMTMGDRAFFLAEPAEFGVELWTSDGTPEGTRMVADLAPGPVSSMPNQLTVLRGQLYFSAVTPCCGDEIWRTDGTAEGTVMIADIRSGPDGSAPRDLTAARSKLYFQANAGPAGQELWVLELLIADFDGSGVVNSSDFFAFLIAFFNLDPAADFDDSGSIDSNDFFAFLRAFFGE